MTTSSFGRPKFDALLPVELKKAGLDRATFTILEDFVVFVDDDPGEIVIPAGLRTDWASIPRFGRIYLSGDDPEILIPSLVHDYLYSVKGQLPDGRVFTRQEADDILRRLMLACGANVVRARIVYMAVRLGGGFHWKE